MRRTARHSTPRCRARATLALAAAITCAAAAPALAQPDPLTLRLQDAVGTPGGDTMIVLRTYASLPVKRGKVRTRAATGQLGFEVGTLAPIASWNGGRVYDADGEVIGTVLPLPDGESAELEFLSPTATINWDDGVFAVFDVTLDAGLVAGQEFQLTADPVLSELFFPLEGGGEEPIDIEFRPGQLRVRAAGASYGFGIGTPTVEPGSGAEVELSTEEPFAIGTGTLVLGYDESILLPGELPSVEVETRHGLVDLTVDVATPGVITITLDSPDGSLNEVPGDLLLVSIPTRPDVPLGTFSPVSFEAGTTLAAPGGAPLALLLEDGGLDFTLDPGIFRNGFETHGTGWWPQVVR